MCGLVGVVRSPGAACPQRATELLVQLGRLAEESGRDAAGLAFVTPSPAATASPDAAHRPDVGVGWIRVVKAAVPWSQLDLPLSEVAAAPVVLLHTRTAICGAVAALANTSPLVAGRLVGTHKGDVDPTTVPGRLPTPAGDTDSERLLAAVDRAGGDPAAVAATLATVVGRVALAWVEHARPERVWLARGAISPLAVTRDADGNRWWASNPAWFRRVDALTGGQAGFEPPECLPEGVVRVIAAGDQPTMVAQATFTPRARPSDRDLVRRAWAGLDPADVAAFRAGACHEVVTTPVPAGLPLTDRAALTAVA
jgi:Glutamine amidotransferase domain